MNKINVDDIISSNFAVSPAKGDVLFELIKEHISRKEILELNFHNINQLTTAFLNNAIGNLYRQFTSEELNNYLKVTGLDDLDKYMFSKVINRSKLNFSDNIELDQEL